MAACDDDDDYSSSASHRGGGPGVKGVCNCECTSECTSLIELIDKRPSHFHWALMLDAPRSRTNRRYLIHLSISVSSSYFQPRTCITKYHSLAELHNGVLRGRRISQLTDQQNLTGSCDRFADVCRHIQMHRCSMSKLYIQADATSGYRGIDK